MSAIHVYRSDTHHWVIDCACGAQETAPSLSRIGGDFSTRRLRLDTYVQCRCCGRGVQVSVARQGQVSLSQRFPLLGPQAHRAAHLPA
ncbi:hypothetical protein PRZ61_08735 [Halomonas pacifica]|uniref:Uncharacterized protein n=1 Tax=Bisbaumannia pacifica TaxID=77098 RepID=A0A510XAB3_9GAMM|nr:hypothetical protein [Halomonas pacifica]MDC8803526.1 hypothetical protein [Halomonas pacifica]GEK47971.1 hypothetical protein HPA02_22540 [Halomonas pacifica]